MPIDVSVGRGGTWTGTGGLTFFFFLFFFLFSLFFLGGGPCAPSLLVMGQAEDAMESRNVTRLICRYINVFSRSAGNLMTLLV